jgi:hypothetical protein
VADDASPIEPLPPLRVHAQGTGPPKLIDPPAGIENPGDDAVTEPVWQTTVMPDGMFHPPPGPLLVGCEAMTCTVAVAAWPPLVAVMITVPATIACTTPVPDTVAFPVFDDDQDIAAPLIAFPEASIAVALSWLVLPTLRLMLLGVTTTDATVGGAGALTVTLAVADTPLPETVMVAVPCLTRVTVPADTVATAVLDELHASVTPLTVLPDASSGTADNVDVFPGTPVTVVGESAIAATGGALTVTVTDAVMLPSEAVTVVLPCFLSVMRPLELTFATVASPDDHETVCPETVLPDASLATAEACVVLPGTPVTEAGESASDATGAALTVAPMVAATLPVDAEIVAVPCLTSVTSPFDETVATPVFDDDHASTTPVTALPFASLRAAEICVVLPGTPVMAVGDSVIDATGPGGAFVAVTPTVADTPLAEAVIVAVPALLSVTKPDEDTLATDELDEVQLSVGGVVMTAPVESVRTAVICVVLPVAPLIDAGESWIVASTCGATVVGTESVRPPTLILIHERPLCHSFTRPFADTVATDESVDDQATAESVTTAPDESFSVAVICVESPGFPAIEEGESTTAATCEVGGRNPVPGLLLPGSVRDRPLKQPYVPKPPRIPASATINASVGRVFAARMCPPASVRRPDWRGPR